jgi:hypothetical protein
VPTGGLTENHDLVASGGADNVWLVQVGEVGAADSDGTDGRYASFEDFRAAVSAGTIAVGDSESGFDVSWTAAGEGDLGFSWTGPLTVDGTNVPIADYPRMDNPNVTVDDGTWQVTAGGATLDLDTKNWTRAVG